MDEINLKLGRLMAEVLRLQRWAGGDFISAAQIFGLMYGFESVLKGDDEEERGISKEVQDKVEELLQDIEDGKQPADGMAIKDRLRKYKIDTGTAGLVIKLCLLQSRLLDGIKKIAKSKGSPFKHVLRMDSPISGWFGALHYLELFDSTEGAPKKLHAVFSATIPRVGETIEPENGSPMRVVGVNYVVVEQGRDEYAPRIPILTPFVMLKDVDGDE